MEREGGKEMVRRLRRTDPAMFSSHPVEMVRASMMPMMKRRAVQKRG
jgi:hypothetical protein